LEAVDELTDLAGPRHVVQLDCVSARERLELRGKIRGGGHRCAVNQDGDNTHAALERVDDLKALPVLRIVEAASLTAMSASHFAIVSSMIST
jgi:hypothetical protein